MQKNPSRAARLRGSLLVWAVCAAGAAPVVAAQAHPLLGILQAELDNAMENLSASDGTRPYFLQYAVTDRNMLSISATLGALLDNDQYHTRMLDVDVRCGDYTLDNTRQIRGRGYYDERGGERAVALPLDGDPLATRQAVWLRTDEVFKAAVKRLAQVQANLQVKVEEEDQANDFSREAPSEHIGEWVDTSAAATQLAQRIQRLSGRFRAHPEVFNSSVSLSGLTTNTLLVNSEGSKLQLGHGWWRIGIQASTIAEDGMELWQYTSFDGRSPDDLPDDATLAQAVDRVIADVEALRKAPIVDPYTGPAILRNRATGVYFHEIFGHRIEGHRQKDVEEGQTFAKKINEPVLPEFLSVYDDPTLKRFKDIELNGFYRFDDEAVPGQRVTLVEDGVLRTFLLSRSPTRGFTQSNGHGRRTPGHDAVSRQGNLIVESTRQMPFDELRRRMIELCKAQNKPYGLLFEDISGGFTTTQRRGPQAFKVLPIMVYKVYVDGRPDELVRGVDIVGTPLTGFSKIVATGDDPDVFNGVCGAESGSVPVSAIAPSILLEQIEVEKKQKSQDRPPILAPPIALENAHADS